MSIPYRDPNPPREWLNLNPFQSYIQQGTLEKRDYLRLAVIVLAYFALRPYIDRLFKFYFAYGETSSAASPAEGEAAAADAPKAKVNANSIRDGKPAVVVGSGGGATASGSTTEATTSGRDAGAGATVKRGKGGEKPGLLEREKEKLVNWDDEPLKRPVVEGDGTDVMEWLGKWDDQI